MVDYNAKFGIEVEAIADEQSAKKAVKILQRGAANELKKGYIELSTKASVPYKAKKGSTKTQLESIEKLNKAQSDLIEHWNQQSEKGFRASSKYVEELEKKYTAFKNSLGGRNKSEQNVEITKIIGSALQPYYDAIKAINTQKTKLRKESTKSNKKQKGYTDHSAKITNENIEGDIKARKKRQLRGIKQTGPAGYGSGWVNAGGLNPHDMKNSELSFYASGMNRQIMRSLKEARRTYERTSLTRDKYDTKEELETELAKRRENDKKTAVHPIEGRNKNNLSAIEKAKGLSEDIRSNILPQLIDKIKNSTDDKETDTLIQKVFDTMDVISEYSVSAGKLILNDVKQTLGLVMGKLGFTTSGNIGGIDADEGTDKTAISRDPKMEAMLTGILNKIAKREDLINQELIKIEQLESKNKKTNTVKETNSFANRIISEAHANNALQTQNLERVIRAVEKNERATQTQIDYDKIENSAERVADTASGKKTDSLIKDTEEDLGSGFNTDSNANDAISAIESLNTSLKDILNNILIEVQSITKNGLNVVGLQKGQTNTESNPSLLPVPAQPKLQQALAMAQYVIKYGKSQAVSGDLPSSKIVTTKKDPHSIFTKLIDAFEQLTGVTANYRVIMSKTSEEQDKMLAERIRKYGISRGNNATDTGDKTMIARRLSLFRNKDYFKTLFKDINITEGVTVDTTEITDKLAKALSGKEMFNAQTGGWLKNIVGAMTGGLAFAFQPSLEKSRSRVEGVNQIMANIRKELNNIVQDIQDKESKLRGMKASGDLKLDAKGNVLESSSTEAKTLVAQLQESKDALNSILADTKYVDEVVGRTHGRINGIIKQLGFTSQPLRKNNAILANLNAGLDKSGKALKYHNRLAELLGYSFRLIARHAGQTFKNLMLQLNPLTHIKKAFQDFMGYNTKWQRTMNVIKYNIRAILQPFMDKIAQFLVNCIGFIDIISMKVQKAFGNVPVSLFDQAAADTEKMKEELEAAANVTAGFDELHDIGSDNSGANDLLGDIYKPQLPQEWIDFANNIGDFIADIIPRLKNIGKWISENWQKLLFTLLGAFLTWKLLKIAGGLLWSALTSGLTKSAFGGLLGKIGGWIIGGFKSLFASGGMIGTITSGATSLGTIFGQALLAITGGIIAGTGGKIAADMIADDTDYNYGLMSAGGKEQDKKSSTGAYATSAITGAIGGGITGFAIGGPIGAAIGATLGAIGNVVTTSLVPGFRELAIQAKEAANEMQGIGFYEGQLQAASSEVNQYTEMVNLFTGSIKTQTDSIYKQGEQLGITKSRMDFLIESVQNGTFYTGMLSGSEEQLAGSLGKLATMTEKTEEASNKLTEAKKKQAKAETTLAIAQDMSVGNLELAAARVEVAYASEVYTVDEATKQMSQIIKKGSDEQKLAMLEDMSPDIKENFKKYVLETEQGTNDICDIFYNMNEEAQKAFSQDYAEEAKHALERTLQALQEVADKSGLFSGIGGSTARLYKDQLLKVNDIHEQQLKDEEEKKKKNQKSRMIKVSAHAIGTNYVPNDGLTYVHKGEAIIPADQNMFAEQGKAFSAQSITNEQLISAINNLEAQMKQGVNIRGQFVQKGNDLVASVEKTNDKLSNSILNNKVYAR